MAKHLRQIVEKKFWIQDAIKKPGALTSAAKRSKVSKSEYIQKHKHEGGKAGQRSRLAQTLKSFHKEETELDEGKYTYKTKTKGKEKTPKWVKRTLNIKTPITRSEWEKAGNKKIKTKFEKEHGVRKPTKAELIAYKKSGKSYKEETELDEAKRPVYKRRGSLRAQIKSKATIAREQAGRRKAIRAAGREAKETGEKVKIRPFGNWLHKRAAAKRKMQE